MPNDCVVRMKFGSHLYGTSTPASDLDYKAVHIPCASDILLQRVKGSISTQRPKAEGEKNIAGEVDEESYSLQKFLALLAEGQTVALDMLFAPDEVILETSELWECIRKNRHRFLTKKSVAFVGYCRTQANKYGIKGSRVASARAAMEMFRDAEETLGATAKVQDVNPAWITALLNDHTTISTMACKATLSEPGGRMETFFECCNRKVNYTASVKLAHEIFSRIHANYGQRAQLAQSNEGIDWKALSHAVRVGGEALELLFTGKITFPLPNAKHIMEIKLGKVPYGDVASQIECLLVEVEAAAAMSTLPDSADTEFIDDLVLDAYKKQTQWYATERVY